MTVNSLVGSPGAFRLWNASGYDSRDLYRFFMRGLRAMGVPPARIRSLRVAVTAAPERSRGCADVGGTRISIAIASPSRFELRRLARLWEHEVSHCMGLDHKDMPEDLLYSNGKTPRWARGQVIRYTGQKARDQLALLTRNSRNANKRS